MKKILPVILTCLSALLPAAAGAEEKLDDIAAVVNRDVILTSELDSFVNKIKSRAQKSGEALPDEITVRREALKNLMSKSLILQLGKRYGLEINDVQLDQTISAMAKRDGKTVDQFYAGAYRDKGLSPLETRNEIREQMMIEELQRSELRRRIDISNQETDQLAKALEQEGYGSAQYQLADISVTGDSGASTAESIARRARSGEDFAKLARQYSSNPRAPQGGYIGWVPEKALPAASGRMLEGSKKGDIIGPLPTSDGFIIIKILDIKSGAAEALGPEKEYRARHILIKPTPIRSDASVEADLRTLKSRAESGEDFGALAKKFSEDPGSAPNGGEMPFAKPGIFDPAFAAALVKLSPGEISDPVRSSFGWHIIKLEEVRSDPDTMAVYRDKAYQILYSRKFSDALEDWLSELRGYAYIKILDPVLSRAGVKEDQLK